MGGPSRTITVKRGVRYNWRESLESILEDGELSKFTVKPSGTLHLYITRPKTVHKSRSPNRSNRKRESKQKRWGVSPWIKSARNIFRSRFNSCSARREQCIQTDCTIPVCYDIDGRVEECGICRDSPIWEGQKSTRGYFPKPTQPPYEGQEPTVGKTRPLQRDLAVPKTKPRSQPRKRSKVPQAPGKTSPSEPSQKSVSGSQRKASSASLQHKGDTFTKSPARSESPKPLKDKTTKNSPDQPGGQDPKEALPSKKDSPSAQPESKLLRSSHKKSTIHSEPQTAEGQRKSVQATQDSNTRKTSRTMNPKRSLEKTVNPLKPTVGLAQLATLNDFKGASKSKLQYSDGREHSHTRNTTRRDTSWDSHGQSILETHARPGLDFGSSIPAVWNKKWKRNHDFAVGSRKKNLAGILWKVYSSEYHEPAELRNDSAMDYDLSLRLRRKNGSHVLQPVHRVPPKQYSHAQNFSEYFPSKLTHWPAYPSDHEDSIVQYNLKQLTDSRRKNDVTASTSKVAMNVTKRLRKVYSYYEIVSEQSTTEVTDDTESLPFSTDNVTTSYPAAVTPVEEKTTDVHSFLLQIKNILSSYFDENCNKRRKLDGTCLRRLMGMKLNRHDENGLREKKKKMRNIDIKSVIAPKPRRKKSIQRMGLRHCY